MPEPRDDARASPLIQWSRTALALAALFASLPLAGRLILGAWGFEGAAEAACLCIFVSGYLYFRGRRRMPAIPDDAAILEHAIGLAVSGRLDEGILLLTDALQRSPRLWQAYQYRGQLRLGLPASSAAALEDFTEAIRLAPGEAHLYALRAHTLQLMGDEAAARADYEMAAALSPADEGRSPNPPLP